MRAAMVSLRRDRAALALSFVLPVVFFSIFAVIFGGRRDSTPRVWVLLVDEDHSRASERLIRGFEREGSLVIRTRPDPVRGQQQPEYTASSAETAVKTGIAPVALVIPRGFVENPVSPGSSAAPVQMLQDTSDPIAPPV